MGAIVDVLLLGKEDLFLLQKRYPEYVLTNMTNTSNFIQRYRLIIPGEDLDDAYYCFLLDNMIAMSSYNFRSRLDTDEKFTERMRKRAAVTLKRFMTDVKTD